jgi:hypothetical protein
MLMTHLEMTQEALKELGDAPPQQLADFIRQRFEAKVEPKALLILKASVVAESLQLAVAGDVTEGLVLGHRLEPAAESTAELRRLLVVRDQDAVRTLQRHKLPLLLDQFPAQYLPSGAAGVLEEKLTILFRDVVEMIHRHSLRGEARRSSGRRILAASSQ